jgi:N-acetylneuraminic acid mutarotase
MKKIYLLTLSALLYISAFAQGPWATLQQFPGTPRMGVALFVINDTVYAGLGADSLNLAPAKPLAEDFYKYDPASDTWTPIADFPGVPRWLSTSFTVGGKGYVLFGITYPGGDLKDVWEYDPGTGSWSQKNDFPGSSRWSGFGFVINDTAYIGGGLPGNFQDLWRYNTATDSWTQKNNYPQAGRHGAIGFSIMGKGYMGLGRDNAIVCNEDFWEYTPSTDSWVQKAAFPDSGRNHATGFSLNNKGYVGLGFIQRPHGNYTQKDFWRYNPLTNTWQAIEDLPGPERVNCMAASNNTLAYLIAGNTHDGPQHKDFFSFDGNTLVNIAEPLATRDISAYSARKKIIVTNPLSVAVNFTVYNLLGSVLVSAMIEPGKTELDLGFVPNSIVVYTAGAQREVKKRGKLVLVD